MFRMRRRDLRTIIGLFTEHCGLKRYIVSMSWDDNRTCRYSVEEIKTAVTFSVNIRLLLELAICYLLSSFQTKWVQSNVGKIVNINCKSVKHTKYCRKSLKMKTNDINNFLTKLRILISYNFNTFFWFPLRIFSYNQTIITLP